MASPKKLLDGATSGNSVAFGWNGGRGTAFVTINGSVTVTLAATPDLGTTWISLGTDAELTATGTFNFDLAPGCLIRYQITGTATAVNAWVTYPDPATG